MRHKSTPYRALSTNSLGTIESSLSQFWMAKRVSIITPVNSQSTNRSKKNSRRGLSPRQRPSYIDGEEYDSVWCEGYAPTSFAQENSSTTGRTPTSDDGDYVESSQTPAPKRRATSSSSGKSSYTPTSLYKYCPEDLDLALAFVNNAISCAEGGLNAVEMPTQKQIQRSGMTTTRQQRARNFLKSIGAVVVTTRTEIAPNFHNLGSLRDFLLLRRDSSDKDIPMVSSSQEVSSMTAQC